MSPLRVVIVGNGMAGARLVQELRAREGGARLAVTVFGAEPHAAYNRVLLSNVLAGRASLDDVALDDPASAGDGGVTAVHRGVAVTAIDREARQVLASDGTSTPYDVLVLATGSRSAVPPIEGLFESGGALKDGTYTFRTIGDCRAMLDVVAYAQRAIVIGGGLLGLEAAQGLSAHGLDVSVLEAASYLMERQLDPRAGRILARSLADLGIHPRTGAGARAVAGKGRVEGVELTDGSYLPTDLLVLACGIRPEVELPRACGLQVERGVVVDDQLRSVTDPAIYAIGECAQHAGHVYGLVTPAWEQARTVATLLAGTDPDARYTGSRLVTRLKAGDLNVAAMGDVDADDGSDGEGEGEGGAEVVSYAEPSRGTYKKLVIRDGRLAGAIMVGEVDTVGTVTQLFDRGGRLPPDRLPLLFGRMGAQPATEDPAHLPD